jgi:hypothetical protein
MRQFYTDSTGAIAFETAAPTPDYALITGTLRDSLWDAKYNERSEDGQRYYHESQRSLYISFISGTYTFTEVKDYETYTANLADEIFKGNWLTAQDTCDNLSTSGIFDATKKAEIKSDIDNYILNNY